MAVPEPLRSYADGFRRYLVELGFCPAYVRRQMGLMAHLSAWLAVHEVPVAELTPTMVDRFLAARRATGRHLITQRSTGPLLDYLRGLGVLTPPVAPVTDTPRQRLLEDYCRFLSLERGLAEGTIVHHVRVAEVFLSAVGEPLPDGLRRLSAEQVNQIMFAQLYRCGTGTAGYRAGCARTLLRWLFLTGHVPADLAAAVPTVARWRLASLPRRAPAEAVAAVLGHCDRRSHAGRHQYAILVLLARLGLRVAEISALTLDDIDWRSGEIAVHGKGGRLDQLPLMWQVGEALADYLQASRPQCATRAVFVTRYAPHRQVTTSAVRESVYRACAQAGVRRFAPHQLRHALACDLLAADTGLEEIGQVLRHQHPSATAVYAKADVTALAALARPWPQRTP